MKFRFNICACFPCCRSKVYTISNEIPAGKDPFNAYQSQPTPLYPSLKDFEKPPDTKKKRKQIPSKLRKEVWYIYNKTEKGKCFCCGDILYFKNHHCSHVIADALGGKMVKENLRPCCASCNLTMKKENLYDFKNRKGWLK